MQAVISSSRRHSRRLGVLLAAMLLLAGTLLAGALRHPGTAGAATSVSCGQVVTASITLANDLTCDVGSAIVVGKAGITINLGGHTITGGGFNGSVGVTNDDAEDHVAFANVTITNGTITSFETGVISSGAGAKISKLRVHQVVRGIRVNRKSTVSANTVWDTQIGIAVAGGATGTTVSSNVVNGSAIYGINLAAGSTASANRVSSNDVGIVVPQMDEPTTLAGNLVTGNDSDGIRDLSDVSTLNSNVANYNGGYGIRAAGGSGQDGKNSAKGNTNPRQCQNVACL